MGEPPWWRNLDEYPPCWDKEKYPEQFIAEGQDFLSNLCLKPLKEVARRVIDAGNGQIPTVVFDQIKVKPRCDGEPWFKHHARLSLSFNKGLMGELWIRNLVRSCIDDRERKGAPNGTFYIEDGNHRALVYAVHLELGKAVYEPVDAIHATSWDIASGILGYQCQKADILENNGRIQSRRHCRASFSMATDIQIDTYKRS